MFQSKKIILALLVASVATGLAIFKPAQSQEACGYYGDFSACLGIEGYENCCEQICPGNSACSSPGQGGPPAPPPAGGSGGGSSGSCPSPQLEFVNGVCVPKSNFGPETPAGQTTLVGLLLLILKYLLILSGMIAVGALVIGGFWYITSGGNEEQAEKGRTAIMNAIIGLVVVILAYAIVNIVTQTLTSSDLVGRGGG